MLNRIDELVKARLPVLIYFGNYGIAQAPTSSASRRQRQIHALVRIGFTLAVEGCANLAWRIMAKRLGPARPRAITWKGAGAWLIFS